MAGLTAVERPAWVHSESALRARRFAQRVMCVAALLRQAAIAPQEPLDRRFGSPATEALTFAACRSLN